MSEKPKFNPSPKVVGNFPAGEVKGSVPKMENPPPPPPKINLKTGK
jgi:hypothetical protein